MQGPRIHDLFRKQPSLLGVWLFLPLSACTAQAPAPIEDASAQIPQILAQPTRCAHTAGAYLYRSDSAWPDNVPRPSASVERPWRLLVSLGEQPTAGYRVTAQVEARVQGYRVIAQLQSPPEGSMTAQVITHPCVILAVPDQGWQTLEVVGPGEPFPQRFQPADAR